VKTKLISVAVLAAASALTFSGCATNESTTAATGTLSGKGASSMKAAQEKWVADYQSKNAGVTVNYSPDGSSAGREAFTAGAVDFAGSDRPLKDEEMGAGKFAGCASDSNALDLPVYVSPIAVIYKLDGVDNLTLDANTLAGIFAGKITKWNDAAIAATNPGVKLPALNITAVHRSDGSGTTNNFTDTLNQIAPTVWTSAASDDWPSTLGGEAAKGTSGVVQAVSSGVGTIGYADASAAKDVSIAKLSINGKTLSPDASAAASILEQSSLIAGRATNDLAYKLNRTGGAYPAVLVSYAIVCQTYSNSTQGALVKGYLTYVTSTDGQQAAATAAGSAPLSSAIQTKVAAAVSSIK
jgi:phosphate transport system substrate-binding protein